MRTLIWMTWLGWLRKPENVTLPVTLVGFYIVAMSLGMIFTEDSAAPTFNWLAPALISMSSLITLGPGIIAKEREQGILASILARPISRTSYVISKWIALAAAVWIINVVSGLIILFAYLCTRPDLILWQEFLPTITATTSCIFGICSWFVLFSTLGSTMSELTNFSKLFSILIIILLSADLPLIDPQSPWIHPALIAVQHAYVNACSSIDGRELLLTVFPIVFLTGIKSIPYQLVSFVSTITAVLALAVWIMNKREVGYGQGG